jgi:uncharacterized sulfatase
MDAVPAILSGIPHLMDEQIISSIYHSNKISGLSEILKSEGYQTGFFHGGINGTMGFDIFTKKTGWEYYGLNEFMSSHPNASNFKDGAWGIYDEAFFNYFCNSLTTFKQPFIGAVFTLSSHPPYIIPANMKGKFTKGTLPIHESIGYTDYALKQFFAQASQEAWFDNTLFIITADHTQENSDPSYNNLAGYYKIPLILYHPTINLQAIDNQKVTQQIDIPATVCDLLGFNQINTTPFGNSIYSVQPQGAITYTNNGYFWFDNKTTLELRNEDILVSEHNGNSLQVQTVDSLNAQKLKAFAQYFNNGLIDNSW